MKTNLLNISGVQVLSKENQRQILGQVLVEEPHDLSKCGCSCSGSVTGPAYCSLYIGCLQVYNCGETKI
ncbi:hypothetical protein [Flavobacterium sp. WV_118_3]|jgi:hypothetical protein|uniref:hypothetical protein n=1 Tax=Flavobacterium sp. WV_118_3 TaxID=3151764 RepID=UPI0012CFF32B|nr:hypothetical protein [Flavobacterium sp.]